VLIPFAKMHAQGNDFVVWDLRAGNDIREGMDKLAAAICDRRFGVGADGLVLISQDDAAPRMTIFNSDGSRATMCGSALRCVARLLAGDGCGETLSIATDSGIKTATVDAGEVVVDLGIPHFAAQDIQLHGLKGDVVDIGNLHFVCVLDSLEDAPHLAFGSILEHDDTFPRGLNSQFVRVTSPGSLEMLIWERGAGATLACGTGAVAAVFSCIHSGKISSGATVDMPGGRVRVAITPSGSFTLAGGVSTVFYGEYQWRI